MILLTCLHGWLEKWLALDSLSYFAERHTSLGKAEAVTVGKEKFEGQNKNAFRRV